MVACYVSTWQQSCSIWVEPIVRVSVTATQCVTHGEPFIDSDSKQTQSQSEAMNGEKS